MRARTAATRDAGMPNAAASTSSSVATRPAGVELLDGGRAFWDFSASVVTYKPVNDRDYYLGQVVGDAAAADANCSVNLNVRPRPTRERFQGRCRGVFVRAGGVRDDDEFVPLVGGRQRPGREHVGWPLDLQDAFGRGDVLDRPGPHQAEILNGTHRGRRLCAGNARQQQ